MRTHSRYELGDTTPALTPELQERVSKKVSFSLSFPDDKMKIALLEILIFVLSFQSNGHSRQFVKEELVDS